MNKKSFAEATNNFAQAKAKFEKEKNSFEDQKQNYYTLAAAYEEKYGEHLNSEKIIKFKGKDFKISRVVNSKIVYDHVKLKKQLTAEQFNSIMDKSLRITNEKGLIEFLKSQNVDMKKLKEFITIDMNVNDSKLDKLDDLGEIDLLDLQKKSCFEVSYGNTYYKVSESK